jgi:hypothetical protein
MAMKRKSSNGPRKRRKREQLFEGIGRMGEEAPARFLFEGKSYEFLDSGAYSFLYREYPNSLRAIKIIYRRESHPIDEFVAAADQEVRLQKRAAEFNLAPQIYASGFIPKNDFYFIQMDFYGPENGWVHVWSGEPEMDAIFCEFVRKLVFEARLYNSFDPNAHFYYHPHLGLRMIDYGKCQEVEPGQEAMRYQQMTNALELNCPQPLAGGRTKKRKRTKKKKRVKKSRRNHARSHARSRFKSKRRVYF